MRCGRRNGCTCHCGDACPEAGCAGHHQCGTPAERPCPVAETADTDAQADRMAALYFSTDDGDAYDAQWLAILDTEVEGKVSIGDCYSYKLQNGGWDITDWNNME
ncbi:MAG: hypothetical protein ACLVJH_01535 [Faecalibacterium prausnitzii]